MLGWVHPELRRRASTRSSLPRATNATPSVTPEVWTAHELQKRSGLEPARTNHADLCDLFPRYLAERRINTWVGIDKVSPAHLLRAATAARRDSVHMQSSRGAKVLTLAASNRERRHDVTA